MVVADFLDGSLAARNGLTGKNSSIQVKRAVYLVTYKRSKWSIYGQQKAALFTGDAGGACGFGTFGYNIIERMPIFDAFYMTIITISTVGFSEIIPLTKVGRSITVVIIILSISVGTYTIGVVMQWLVGGELQKIFGRS